MENQFKGRSLLPGVVRGQVAVGLDVDIKKFQIVKNNLVYSCKESTLNQKVLYGKVLCVKSFKGEVSDDSLLLNLICKSNLPSCILVADKLPDFFLSVLAFIKNLYTTSLIVVDNLGDEFLDSLNSGDIVSVCDDTVSIQQDKLNEKF